MEYKFTLDWFSMHAPMWKEILCPIFKDKEINAIELGSFEGRASTWLMDNLLTNPKSTLDCVDTWNNVIMGPEPPIDWKVVKENFDYNMKGFGDRVRVHDQKTVDYLKHRDELTDFIYVDAGHDENECLNDSVLSHLLLKKGGVIIFDDYLWTGLRVFHNTPKGAIDAFMQCYSEEYNLLGAGYQVILQKI